MSVGTAAPEVSTPRSSASNIGAGAFDLPRNANLPVGLKMAGGGEERFQGRWKAGYDEIGHCLPNFSLAEAAGPEQGGQHIEGKLVGCLVYDKFIAKLFAKKKFLDRFDKEPSALGQTREITGIDFTAGVSIKDMTQKGAHNPHRGVELHRQFLMFADPSAAAP
jgi:hypothetical protein